MKFYKTKLDIKGRISLPAELRNTSGMHVGEKLILETAKGNELIISSENLKSGNFNIKLIFSDFSKGLYKTMKTLAKIKTNILKSQSTTGDGKTTWDALIHTHEDAKTINKRLVGIKEIKKLKIAKYN